MNMARWGEALIGEECMTETHKQKIRAAIERLPKVELHVHFGGSISSEKIMELAVKNGIDPEEAKKCTANDGTRYGSHVEFIDSYRMRCRSLQNEEDFEEACIDVLSRLCQQNMRYAEITISVTAYRLGDISADVILTGIEAGLNRIRAEHDFDAKFIFDIGRQFGAEHGWQTAREALKYESRGVIALGLGGDELHYAPEIYAEHYAFVKKNGLHRVAHAGEVVGSDSVWGALKSLDAERIGHGIGSRGDDALLEHLRVHRIPLEMCPTSNVKTGAIRSLADHPLPEFLRRGLFVTLNSDDPAMFGSTLAEEYLVCYDKLGLDWEEIKTLALNGVKASFLPDMYKQEMLEDFEKEIADIETDLGLS
jgi:adenosine deaminase